MSKKRSTYFIRFLAINIVDIDIHFETILDNKVQKPKLNLNILLT